MYSNRLLINLKSAVLYSNFNSTSLSKICAAKYHLNSKLVNQNRDSWVPKKSLPLFCNKRYKLRDIFVYISNLL